jgi:hypothetical protein
VRDGRRQPLPVRRLRFELPSAQAGERVKLRSPVVFRLLPLGRDPALLLQLVQCRVERSFADLKHIAGDRSQAKTDGPPMQGLQRQDFSEGADRGCPERGRSVCSYRFPRGVYDRLLSVSKRRSWGPSWASGGFFGSFRSDKSARRRPSTLWARKHLPLLVLLACRRLPRRTRRYRLRQTRDARSGYAPGPLRDPGAPRRRGHGRRSTGLATFACLGRSPSRSFRPPFPPMQSGCADSRRRRERRRP